ncbi:MAG: glycosyltransferase family 2 protein [Nitrospira sp.]|nr:glycosyltransferase family 2 protein [Nitrospira sp.]
MDRYVIITPAHNEEAFITKTIESIINQTLRPVMWIVVNDGSSDSTAELVESYRARHGFIRLINVERSGNRNFGNKVRAFNQGLELARHVEYDFIGNLDADISFERDYFQRLLAEFQKDPVLGLAGGMIASFIDGKFVKQNVSPDSVAGAVQLFRRSCFEEVGGYVALPLGGIDAAAEILARMRGWMVRTVPELSVLEHRRTGSATASPLGSRIREGRRLYSLGYNWWFFLLRCIYRSMARPRIIGSGAAIAGFLLGVLRREPLVLPPEAVRFLRTEQREKFMRNLRLPH